MRKTMNSVDEMLLMHERHNARRAEKERIKNLSIAEFDMLMAKQWYEMMGSINDESEFQEYKDFYTEQFNYYTR
jgi:hypothetical protein